MLARKTPLNLRRGWNATVGIAGWEFATAFSFFMMMFLSKKGKDGWHSADRISSTDTGAASPGMRDSKLHTLWTASSRSGFLWHLLWPEEWAPRRGLAGPAEVKSGLWRSWKLEKNTVLRLSLAAPSKYRTIGSPRPQCGFAGLVGFW